MVEAALKVSETPKKKGRPMKASSAVVEKAPEVEAPKEDEAKKARQERARAAAVKMWERRKAEKASGPSLAEIVKKGTEKASKKTAESVPALSPSLSALNAWALDADKSLRTLIERFEIAGQKSPEAAVRLLRSALRSIETE